MGCRIGMATDVPGRVAELKGSGKVPQWAKLRILKSSLTYAAANKAEEAARKQCGVLCEGQAGGGYKDGRVWSVYRLDW